MLPVASASQIARRYKVQEAHTGSDSGGQGVYITRSRTGDQLSAAAESVRR